MNTADLFKYKTVFSLEVFPPKRESSLQSIYSAFDNLKEIRPDYISVTYGAGGSSNINATANIADRLVHNYGYTAVAHLAGIGLKKADVEHIIDNLLPMGVNNILALRGDERDDLEKGDFEHAVRQVQRILPNAKAVFGIEDNKNDSIKVIKGFIKPEDNMDICELKTKYPQGGDAFKADRIILCGICACPPSAEIHKSALGAENSLPWEHFDDTMQAGPMEPRSHHHPGAAERLHP